MSESGQSRRGRFITDPRHLAALAGSSYLVLRPPDDVTTAFMEAQDQLRQWVNNRVSFPRPHITICGFPRFATDEERRVVETWAQATSSLDVTTRRVSAFPSPTQVVIAEVDGHPHLRLAAATVRSLAADAGVSFVDDIAVSDWVFHMSMGYCDLLTEDEWRKVVDIVSELDVRVATGAVTSAELCAFDGGPEQLITEVGLTGSA